MTTARRPRFAVRHGFAKPDEALFEGVPDHLLYPIQDWVRENLLVYPGLAEEIAALLRIVPHFGMRLEDLIAAQTDVGMLAVVDEILSCMPGHPQAAFMKRLLDAGGSTYEVVDWQTDPHLERRVDTSARDAYASARSSAEQAPNTGSASEHLAAAWTAIYGRNPDPVRAWSESIKAVEAAAHHVVQPNHAKATLGTMLGEIRGPARAKFSTTIPAQDPMAVVQSMMEALWNGQTSRHGAQTQTQPETAEAARAGVHLAVTLVQWFSSGAVTRNP